MLITGASRGIGAATALLAARDGYAVAVNYRKNEKAAHEVVSRIRPVRRR
jgi:Dehydrogenases with different specificities (related to short-chain alcohol dehydrogenases)